MTNQTSLGVALKPLNPYYTSGKKIKQVEARYSVLAAAVADADTYVLAEGLALTDRIDSVVMEGGHIALTAAIDNDLGFYSKADDGTLTALDADILLDGQTLASAVTTWLDLLNLGSADRALNIGELLDLTVEDQPANLCLVLTTNTKSTATSTILNVKTRIECSNTN